MEFKKKTTASHLDSQWWRVSAVIREEVAAMKALLQTALLVIIPLLPAASSRADGDMTLVFKVRASRPACTVQADKDGTIVIPDVTAKELDGNNIKLHTGGATFKLTLKNCTAAGGTMVPKIRVWGNRSIDSAGNKWLFSDPSSTAKNVGFIFASNSTGWTSGDWVEGADGKDMTTEATAAKVVVPGNTPKAPMNDKTVDFWVNVSTYGSGATSVTPGTLTASMHFDVVFE